MGLPYSSDDKEYACNSGDPGSIPGLGRSPGEGNDNPLQYSCLENPTDRGTWWAGYSPWGLTELDTTERQTGGGADKQLTTGVGVGGWQEENTHVYSLLFSVVYILTTVTFKLPRLVSPVELGKMHVLACKPTTDGQLQCCALVDSHPCMRSSFMKLCCS